MPQEGSDRVGQSRGAGRTVGRGRELRGSWLVDDRPCARNGRPGSSRLWPRASRTLRVRTVDLASSSDRLSGSCTNPRYGARRVDPDRPASSSPTAKPSFNVRKRLMEGGGVGFGQGPVWASSGKAVHTARCATLHASAVSQEFGVTPSWMALLRGCTTRSVISWLSPGLS